MQLIDIKIEDFVESRDLDFLFQADQETWREFMLYNFNEKQHQERILSYIDKIKSKGGKILVARIKDKTAGIIVGEIYEYFTQICGFIQHIYVCPEYRKNGIGKKLIENLEDYYKSIGCNEMEMFISINNDPSTFLAKKQGFKPTRYIFNKFI